jgi:Ca-activated chloride channel family protein
MLTLALPWCFLLLPLPWLLRRLLPEYKEPRLAVRVPFVERLASLSGQSPQDEATVVRRSRKQWVLLLIAWCLLVCALTRPQWLEPPVTRELPMRDLLLAVDLSGSMSTADFTDSSGQVVDRLTAAKQVLSDFLARREGDRVGLILFGSVGFVQAPFTADLNVVGELLDEAQVGMLGPRTMLGDAMGLAITLFDRSDSDNRVMIVLTDGNDTGSLVPPERAAEIARDKGVVVHTVAIGDPTAVGEQALDEATLTQVAELTGGGFYRATDRAQMETIYAQLDALNPRIVEEQSYRPQRELFHWPLGALLILAFGVSGWQAQRSRTRHTALKGQQSAVADHG